MMEESIEEVTIDSNPSHLYVVNVYMQDENIAQYVVSSYEVAEEFVNTLMEDDEEVDFCGIRPVMLDSLVDNITLH